MIEVFVAYASSNAFQAKMISRAAESASTPKRKLLPWSDRETSGHPIARSVESWIERADSFIADVSVVNDNVTYEVGFAIGLGKPCRLIRSTHVDFAPVKKIGLIDTLGHDSYDFEAKLIRILQKPDHSIRWPDVQNNKGQPIFILQPPQPTEWSLRLVSAIKKTAKMRFRAANPSEMSRLTGSEAYEQVASSFGVIACWVGGDNEEAVRNNQRAAFVFGLAQGFGLPALLIAQEGQRLPLDLQDIATRWASLDDFDKILSTFRDRVADALVEFVEPKHHAKAALERISCGNPIAENEASELGGYFLETEAYRKALNGDAHVLVGRKGSGKTAIFLQTRDHARADRQNIIVDLIPDGHQLVKMKEFILDHLGHGARKEVLSAFWEYVVWLEIAYKLLEKDEQRAYRDGRLFNHYTKLRDLFDSRVDTGVGDFSERLKKLSSQIIQRFEQAQLKSQDKKQLDSSKVLNIVYGENVHDLREGVISYLHLKGHVQFLFDNLDRFWTPGGFTADDALIVVGLVESLQDVTRRFRKAKLDFRWSIFVRSDVYEFLIRGMADYGKLTVQSLEWSDREMLSMMFRQRIMASLEGDIRPWEAIWSELTDPMVDGVLVEDFLIDGSLMRPRYLIRLFEAARHRAISFSRHKIEAKDYEHAIRELGWQVIEDLDREIADLIPNGADLLFDMIKDAQDLTVDKFKYLAGKRLKSPDSAAKLLEVMLWNGSVGVLEAGRPRYIFDCGYKRQYLSGLVDGDGEARLSLHPTLLAAVA